MSLDEARLSLARARTWSWLAELFARGLTPRAKDWLPALPSVAATVPEQDDDAHAADHYAVFSLELRPHASVFLSRDGLLGGPEEARCSTLLQRTGARDPSLDADHLARLAGALAWLGSARAEALDDGQRRVASSLTTLEAEVLEALVRWLPCLVVTMQRLDVPLYAEALQLTAELAASYEPHEPELPEPLTIDLEDARTDLRRIATHLRLPVRSGWMLTPRLLARLGDAIDVPHGFGSRQQRLQALLHGAVEHDRLAALLDALDDELDAWKAAYETLEEVGLPTAGWRARLQGTRALVTGIRDAGTGGPAPHSC